MPHDTIWKREKLVVQDRSVEWLCAWLMLAWATTLALPGDTLALPAFSGFRTLGAPLWAIAFGIVGGGRMAALIINGRWPRTARVRQAGAFLGAFIWVQVAILIFRASAGHAVGAERPDLRRAGCLRDPLHAQGGVRWPISSPLTICRW